ncbi:histidine kinase [Pelomonas sp. APW6]|uniref:Histidine kinase n=1 Tax=Roseateles subflavus TaxID=3053353 RepID=A0ABT7LHP2_9BURK|nr:histidine kinase [Pelomonas sp. APW6]MDL5031076.1 histidine kinase [Pelomonas sp. APW6]
MTPNAPDLTLSWHAALRRDATQALGRIARNENGIWRNSQFLGAVFGGACGGMGLFAGVIQSRGALWEAALAAFAFGCGFLGLLGLAWLRPLWFSGRPAVALSAICGFGAALVGMTTGLRKVPVDKTLPWSQQMDGLVNAAKVGMPMPLILVFTILLVLILTASQRREHMARDLALAQSRAEQEQARREASEARLRLLQAQIQPHFIFNTLAAVQHWVDTGDARASPLLRQLSTFLRGSAELMLQPEVRLADELQLVQSYLGVMQARWGERLRYALDIDPACAAAASLPPGIVLSLVENALEHGIAPTLDGAELHLRLTARPAGGWQLLIEDSGVGLTEGWQEGLGLSNSRARLQGVFGSRASLDLTPRADGPGTRVCLQLERAQ